LPVKSPDTLKLAMVEIVEYALVFLVATLFTGASVSVYNEYQTTEATLEGKTSFSALVGLARQAAWNGSSTGALVIPESNLACSAGTLTISASAVYESGSLGVNCGFNLSLAAGLHVFHFDANSTELSLTVN